MVRRLGMVVARGPAQQIISIMAKYPKAYHLFGTFAEVLHGVPSKALRSEVDGTLAHAMETLNARPAPSSTGPPATDDPWLLRRKAALIHDVVLGSR